MNNKEIKQAYEKEFGKQEVSYSTDHGMTTLDAIGISFLVAGAVMVIVLITVGG